MKQSFTTCPSALCSHSNSCIWAQTQALPRFPSTAAVCMGRPVLSAVWPETHTAPGMEHPVLATCQTPRGLWHKHLWHKPDDDLITLSKRKTMETIVFASIINDLKMTNLIGNCNKLLLTTFYRRFRRQDVRNGDPNTLCSGGMIKNYCSVWLLKWKHESSGSCNHF